jgi:hypothetical protein
MRFFLSALLVVGVLVCGSSALTEYQSPIMLDMEALPQRLVLAHVAGVFRDEGFVRSNPFELSPRQMDKMPIFAEMKSEAERLLKDKDALASLIETEAKAEIQTKAENKVAEHLAADEALMSHVREEAAVVMEDTLNKENQVRDALMERALRKAEDPNRWVEPELVETDSQILVARKKGFLKKMGRGLRRGLGALGRGLGRAAKFGMGLAAGGLAAGAVAGGGVAGLVRKGVAAVKKVGSIMSGDMQKALGQRTEDCMACRFIWKQVEMDVSNAKYVEDVQASFEHNCLDAQKSEIFFKGCEDMYDDMYALTDDYMANDYSVDQMCQRANMCKK